MEGYTVLMWFTVTRGLSLTSLTEHHKGGNGSAFVI